ncbi:STAS domain-containing protein [Streptomyces sp. XY431]|uniref:STAS domain-containing protein n=1 Tax=Streptomyces sp. XY431 TaxID=1415562 RepID=UPI0007C728E4|nr:STAS domain-containing protein [Streptomyces sp. XY431]
MHLSAGGAGDTGDERDTGEPGEHRPGELRIEVRRTGTVRIVSVGGELDHDSADGLRTALSGLPEDGLARILVDLAELSFCDSTGVNILLQARQDAELAGVRLEIAAPRPSVVRLFAVTGADAVLRIHPSVGLALAEDGGRAGADGPSGPGSTSDPGSTSGAGGPDDPGPTAPAGPGGPR